MPRDILYTKEDVKEILFQFVNDFSGEDDEKDYQILVNAVDFMDDKSIKEEIDIFMEDRYSGR